MNGIPILFVVIVVLGSSTIQSYAHSTDSDHVESNFLKSDFMFKVTSWVEDVRLSFTSDADKPNLIKEFITDKQNAINNAVDTKTPTSLDIEDRRMELITKLSSYTTVTSDVYILSDMNKIRLLYSQFEDCTTSCSPDEKSQFNDSVNQLNSWNNHCTESFDIDQYSYDMESYDKLSNICPELKTIPVDQLRGMVQ